MKKLFVVFLVVFMVFILVSEITHAANFTMSWDFQIFNNLNARQVAINTAEKQDSMIQEEEDPMERFIQSFERRLMSRVHRNLIDQIMSDEELAAGEYQVGDLNVSIIEDPDTGEVTLEITNVVTGETSIINYGSDEWPTDYNW